MHFPVTGECLGWRTTDFEELYGDLGQWTMTKELAREVSCFYLSSHWEVWWIAESVLNMSRSRADGTMSSWLLYFRSFTNFPKVSYIIWTPLWMKCASAAAILSNISANEKPGGWSISPRKNQNRDHSVFFSFGVDPLNWQSSIEIGEVACSTTARALVDTLLIVHICST